MDKINDRIQSTKGRIMENSVKKDISECRFDYYYKDSKVFLNEKEIDCCYLAKEEEGLIWCHQTDENGNIIMNRNEDAILNVCLKGDVRIESRKIQKHKDKYATIHIIIDKYEIKKYGQVLDGRRKGWKVIEENK